MEPICVVPALLAKQYDGTNQAEISEWVGYPIELVTEQYMHLRVAFDEIMWIHNGYWLFATMTDPPMYAGLTSDSEMRSRNVLHPGTVTIIPVPPVDPPTEPVTP